MALNSLVIASEGLLAPGGFPSLTAATRGYIFVEEAGLFVRLTAYIQKQDVLRTAALDALLRREGITDQTQIDAIIAKGVAIDTSLDALIRPPFGVVSTVLDAILIEERVPSGLRVLYVGSEDRLHLVGGEDRTAIVIPPDTQEDPGIEE